MSVDRWSCLSAVALALLACSTSRGADETVAHVPPAAPGSSPEYDERFRRHWSDGKAELAGYELHFPRYGEIRDGTAVSVFVTEPFEPRDRVKPERSTPGQFPVLKLNLVQDFATGIYDYNLMTSAFVQLETVHGRPPGSLTKVSFTSQEWCGHVYQHALFDADRVRTVQHSYFEGEADRAPVLAYPAGGFSEDALLPWARGLAGPRVPAGARVEVPLLRSLEYARLSHVPLTWDRALLTRRAEPSTQEVPAGRFEVDVLTASVERESGEKSYPAGAPPPASRMEWTYYVERAFPHHVVRWTRSDGVDARMTGVARLPYWEMQGLAGVAGLRQLGLTARAPRMP